MELNIARTNMLQKQIRPCCLLNEKTLTTIASIPREQFVPQEYGTLAYADTAIPLMHQQHMLTPKLIGHILSALNLTGAEAVLEIGTGSGYLSALLAILSEHVTSVELYRDIADAARKNLQSCNINNVTIKVLNGITEFKATSLFDVIVITGSLARTPTNLFNYLTIGGKLFAVVGKMPIMRATVYTKLSTNSWSQQKLFETVVAPLENVQLDEDFVF